VTVVLVPMSEAEFTAYAAESIPEYARDKVRSGQWAEENALELSRRGLEEMLPQGVATHDNHLFSLREAEGSAVVGMLWFAVQEQAGRKLAYVYDVAIRPPYQRRGYATEAFAALEGEARTRGLAGIGLHVFGHNPGARALYEKLGYAATNIHMFKSIPRANDR
jgi:ribosomal protein S18 acetylase RimI-like enzyme